MRKPSSALRVGLFAGAFALCLSASDATAQTTTATSGVVFHIVGGVNSASLSLPLADIPAELDVEVSTGRRTALIAGALIGVRGRGSVAFETGALFSDRGATASITAAGLGTADTVLRMLYIDVPAHVNFGIAKADRCQVRVIAGPTASFLLKARQSLHPPGEATVNEDFTDETSAFDLGITAGGRVEFGRVFVDVRYTHGLLNLATDTGPDGETIKSRVVSILGGWRLGK